MKRMVMIFILGVIFLGCNNGTDHFENRKISEVYNEYEVIYYINLARKSIQYCEDDLVSYPVNELISNEFLKKSAVEHAFDLIKTNQFSHNGSGESSDITGTKIGRPSKFSERIRRQGYIGYKVGENIARGYESPKEIVQAWLNSPEHCKIIMDETFKDVGIGTFKSKSSIIIVANFGVN